TPQATPPPTLTITRRNADGTTTSQDIDNVKTYKYLGVIFDPKLRWTAHTGKVVAKATWWSFQVARLSRASGGMSPRMVRQLFNTVAVPAFTYAADVWYTGIHKPTSGSKRLGSIAVTNKLTSIQRRVTKIATGSLNSAAAD